MAGRKYQGFVAFEVSKAKGTVKLVPTAKSEYSEKNPEVIFAKLKEIAKQHSVEIDQWSLFEIKGGTEPVLMTYRYGKPCLTLFPKDSRKPTSRKPSDKILIV